MPAPVGIQPKLRFSHDVIIKSGEVLGGDPILTMRRVSDLMNRVPTKKFARYQKSQYVSGVARLRILGIPVARNLSCILQR